MKKLFLKIIIILISLILIVVGCIFAHKIYKNKKVADNEYNFVMSGKEAAKELPPTIEEIKSVEEDKSLLKEKEEYLKLFKKYCGFSLPDYFIFPKGDPLTDWKYVDIEETVIEVTGWFIFEKRDALEILEHLRRDDSWVALPQGSISFRITTPKVREICYHFAKASHYDYTVKGMYAEFNFIYNEENDFYLVFMQVGLVRDPPPGTSWPEFYCH